jgi:chorismate--pyruvate lyase
MTGIQAGLYRREPRWRSARQVVHSEIPKQLATWLFDQASLTLRLQHHCGAETFHVEVLWQKRGRMMLNEARALGMTPGEYALLRQVHLYCGDQAVVFARTVIPLRSLKGRQKRLAHLGKRSLGAVIFADKSMRRGDIEVCRLRAGQSLFAEAQAKSALFLTQKPLWGRRSVFTVNGKKLLVSEFFLPALLQSINTAEK